jgi:hypothetical protein
VYEGLKNFINTNNKEHLQRTLAVSAPLAAQQKAQLTPEQ